MSTFAWGAITVAAVLVCRYAWRWVTIRRLAGFKAWELGPGYKVKSVRLHPLRDRCHVVWEAPGTIESIDLDVTIGSVEP